MEIFRIDFTKITSFKILKFCMSEMANVGVCELCSQSATYIQYVMGRVKKVIHRVFVPMKLCLVYVFLFMFYFLSFHLSCTHACWVTDTVEKLYRVVVS